MKIKNLFAILLAITFLTCTCVVPTSAKEATDNNTNIEIIINDDISEETKEKIVKYFENGEPITDKDASTYGLTCSLFGHKLESSVVDIITHKASATSPRCLKKTYLYEACTRCDYETSEVIDTEYIVCC